MLVLVLDLGRSGRGRADWRGSAREAPASSCQRPWRLPLVPEIDDVELVVGLALQQPAAVARAQHLIESFLAVAAGQQQEEAEELGRRGRHVGVVPCTCRCRSRRPRASGSSATARSSATLMFLPSRAAASFSFLQDAPLDPRGIGATEVEPGLGVVGRSRRSRLRRHGSRDRRRSRTRRRAPRLSGIEQDPPPERGGGEHVARFGRRRSARATQLRVDLVEARFEDEVVGAGEAVDAADLARGRAPTRGGCHSCTTRQAAAPGGVPHVTLVRSCCFSAWRSSASAISRSRSAG